VIAKGELFYKQSPKNVYQETKISRVAQGMSPGTLLDFNKLLPSCKKQQEKLHLTRMWADAKRDGRPAEYWWRPVLNAAKFG